MRNQIEPSAGVVGFGQNIDLVDSERLLPQMPRAELPAALPGAERATDAGGEVSFGEPLSIKQVARLIGCSAWTVRMQLIPRGLPFFRSGPGTRPTGKLIFYRLQVLAWLAGEQAKLRPASPFQVKGGFRR